MVIPTPPFDPRLQRRYEKLAPIAPISLGLWANDGWRTTLDGETHRDWSPLGLVSQTIATVSSAITLRYLYALGRIYSSCLPLFPRRIIRPLSEQALA